MEYYGRINVMKTGIVFSDMINTVSLTYAQEIQRPEYGVGLDGLLRSVSYKLTGITNGIDIKVWDPGQDSFIPSPYRLEDLRGKADCKEALQKRFSLDVRADIPLFGLISRLVEQKGVDLVLNIIPEMIREGCQIVILGNGDAGYEELLRGIAGVFPERCGVFIGFDEVLAHAIEAGSDFFLMPSRFEPCGLNQMISMRYGSIPIVTPVGGLMDTVRALGEGEKPCGIRVLGTDSRSLLDAVREAVRIFWTKPKLMAEMKKNAMKKDVSWTGPAKQYFDMYRKQKDLKESRRF
jgi:starch synthase